MAVASSTFLTGNSSLLNISSKNSSNSRVGSFRNVTVASVSEQNDSFSRRQATLASIAAALSILSPLSARADDFYEGYKKETQDVIDKVKYTLALGRDDPEKDSAVNSLRELSNGWVAKYRREKAVAGKPSFSNMYSVLNAISGHYISFGSSYPIPKKRATRILEEVSDAERALSRGR